MEGSRVYEQKRSFVLPAFALFCPVNRETGRSEMPALLSTRSKGDGMLFLEY
jgi:hypothetical protein